MRKEVVDMEERKPNYTCEICTDYIDPSKREEILQRCAKIIAKALKENAMGEAKKDE